MKTNFKIGDKVIITDDRFIYGTYEEMAKKMNLTKWESTPYFRGHGYNGNTGVIVNIQTHFNNDRNLVGVDLGKEEIIITVTGLELLNDIPEKWCIEMTKENIDILLPWWKKTNPNSIFAEPIVRCLLLSEHPTDASNYWCGSLKHFLDTYSEYKNITLEEFKTITSKTINPIMETNKTIQISRELLNEYYSAATRGQKEFINENFKIDGTTTVKSIIGLHDMACDTWKPIIKGNHPECFPVTKTAIELAVEKAGKPEYNVCEVKIEEELILVELPTANPKWSFAAFEWVLKFCKENPKCYPVHRDKNNNTNYLYIQWND